jgi:hypothetical protein
MAVHPLVDREQQPALAAVGDLLSREAQITELGVGHQAVLDGGGRGEDGVGSGHAESIQKG